MLSENLVKMSYRETPFTRAILNLELPKDHGEGLSIFLRATASAFLSANFDEPTYPTIQTLEPSVLTEIEFLQGAVGALKGETEISAQAECGALLSWLYKNLPLASTVQRLNLSAVLAGFCRTELAHSILLQISDRPRVRHGDLSFEYQMLLFATCNRLRDRLGSNSAMHTIRLLGESGKLSRHQILDASAQAIVWFHKSKEIDVSTYEWLFKASVEILKSDSDSEAISPSHKSAWYRAAAMRPAGQYDKSLTREIMAKAETFARESIALDKSPFALNNMKTYLESTLKEYTYVTRDYERAEAVGVALLKLDPFWSPNWAEVAEMYMQNNRYERAAQLLNKAIEIGPPYLLSYHYYLAECECQIGNIEQGVKRFHDILLIDSSNRSAALSGLKWAREKGHSTLDLFKDACRNLAASMNQTQLSLIQQG